MNGCRSFRCRMPACLLSLLPVVLMSACAAQEQLEAGMEVASTPESWSIHRDPMGFSLECPADWDIDGDEDTGQVTLTSPEGAEIVVWPVFVPRPIEAEQAGLIESALLSRLGYGDGWNSPQVVGNNAVRSTMGEDGDDWGVALFAWASTPAGTSGTLYLIPETQDAPQPDEETVSRILGSFRLTGTEDSNEADRSDRISPSRRRTTWTDPNEGAFSVELEDGWKATGGIVRPNSILTQAKIEASSPDGGIYLYFGDTFPWFIEPNQFLGLGQIYRDPMGGSQPVWYYLPGSQFVSQYLLPRRHDPFELIEEVPQPQVAQRLLRIGINEYQAGIVRYRFRQEGRPFQGSALCITERLGTGGLSTWHVYRLALVETAASRIAEGEAALGRMVGSFKINPRWLQLETAKAGVNSRIISEMTQEISTTVNAAFENQQRVTEHALAEDAKVRRGIEEIYDPVMGKVFEVSSGSNYYWTDVRGNIVGTEIDTTPSIDFRQMLILH